MLNKRACGILLHPTSLPGPGGIGSFGADARRFVDLLQQMGMSYWQVLPLTPPASGNSPYSAFSAFAGNPLLIDLEQLVSEGDLSPDFCRGCYPEDHVDFDAVSGARNESLFQAAATFLARADSARMREFREFCAATGWLHDYALFMALKRRFHGLLWSRWPHEAAYMAAESYQNLSAGLAHEILLQKYLQWQFARQWQELREYANARGIAIIGDIPIFVAYDSADVWSHRELFLLDMEGNSTFVAGVPPDYFSATGQMWGNPLYDWDALEQSGYRWWIERFRATFDLFDAVRVDHFRGFEAAWYISAGAETAEEGEWVTGPGEKLFDAIRKALGHLPIIAEDLGVITPGVIALRDRYNFPGMKILQFAFEKEPINLPHLHVINGVVYTGTHDNNTSKGWYNTITDIERLEMCEYLGSTGDDGVEDIIRAALMSVADTAVIPLQDLLKLGSEARMNIPGTAYGNWEWRFTWDMLPEGLAISMRKQLERYGRV